MVSCPGCGEENPERFRFCSSCGRALDEVPKAQAEERKVISILFVDLVGFTARSHNADPEDIRATLAPYYALLKREIERFGGTLEKFIGDAVMAVFGAPVTHEDDPERAVRSALRITQAIEELNDSSALDLSVRAAVNTGEGLIALDARPEAGEGMVTGDVVNTASRLQNVAPVNGVVVGEATYRSTKAFINYEELEPVTVKGKPEPIAIWSALSARSRFGIDTEIVPTTPFIGRDYETMMLQEAFRRTVRESSIQLVTVVGEPGVGKSRLLSEFFSFIDERDELVFWRQGRSLPYGEGITFWALGEIIKAHAGILESDSSQQAADKLGSAITAVVKQTSEHAWFLSRLGPLVGIETLGSAGAQKEESFTAWRRFLEAIAEDRPLVLVFEDLHWADPSLLEFIEHLLDWVSGVPLFVVCTARPELYDKHPTWGGGKRNINIITLPPLTDSQTAELISSLLSQAVLPAEIHAALLDRAGGNPLYAGEFIRMLTDKGILTQKGRVVSLVPDVDIAVPDSVQALIAARLDTLSPERKSLLHDASVVGRVFWSGAIAAIGGNDAESVRQGLHQLVGKELVRPSRTSSIEGEQEYSFLHALIRDVCYGQIPRAARSRKHKAAAEWIERAAERLDDSVEVLAHHYSTALELATASGASDIVELEQQTRRFVIAAADRMATLDPAKALALYRQALELLDPNDPETLRVLREAGATCRSLKLLSEGQRYLERAIAGSSARQDPSGEAMALASLAVILRDQGHSTQGRDLVVRAIELLEQETPGEELSRAYANLSYFEDVSGSLEEAITWANKAVETARSAGTDKALAGALAIRGLTRFDSGDITGLEDLTETVRIGEAAGDIETLCYAYHNLAESVCLIEGPRKGLELNAKAQELGRSYGYVHMATWSRMGALPMLFELGMWDELLQQAAELIAQSQEHDALLRLWVSLSMAPALFHRRETRESLSLEERFLPASRDMDELEALAPSLALAALWRAYAGDHATTLTLVREFDRKTKHAKYYRARYLPDIVRALCLIGNNAYALRLLLSESEACFARDRHAIVTASAIVAEANGGIEQALALYHDAARRWNEYGFVLEEGQALLGAGRCLTSLGRRPEASFKLQEARRMFVELGALRLVVATEDFLANGTALSS